MPYVYSKSRSHLYIQVVSEAKGRKSNSKNITVGDYAFVLLVADMKEFIDLKYPFRKDPVEKRENRGRPKTRLCVHKVNRIDHKVHKYISFTLGDDYEIDDIEQQIRFFLKRRFGQT